MKSKKLQIKKSVVFKTKKLAFQNEKKSRITDLTTITEPTVTSSANTF